MEPLRNPGLPSHIASGLHQSRDANVSKILFAIHTIWMGYARNDASQAFSSCLIAIGTVGNFIKTTASDQIDSQISIPVATLVGLLQGLSSLARRMGASPADSQALLDALRLEYAHLRRDAKTDMEKQIGMVVCLIEIIKICINDSAANPGIVDSLLASTQGILQMDDESIHFPKSVSTTFYFYVAKHMLFLDDYEGARQQLAKALAQCRPGAPSGTAMYRNRRRIIWHLIPLMVAKGYFPSKGLLAPYPELSSVFKPLLRAISRKNISELRQVISSNEALGRDFFILLKKMENLIYRGIIKETWKVTSGKRRIDFTLFSEIAKVPEEIAEEILANLLLDNLISGYISYEERALMLTGAHPFPLTSYS